MAKAAFSKKEKSFHEHTGLKYTEETSKVLHLERKFVYCSNFYSAKVDQEYLKSLDLWCWRRMEKIS
jgi:hypothetical protein